MRRLRRSPAALQPARPSGDAPLPRSIAESQPPKQLTTFWTIIGNAKRSAKSCIRGSAQPNPHRKPVDDGARRATSSVAGTRVAGCEELARVAHPALTDGPAAPRCPARHDSRHSFRPGRIQISRTRLFAARNCHTRLDLRRPGGPQRPSIFRFPLVWLRRPSRSCAESPEFGRARNARGGPKMRMHCWAGGIC